MQTLVKTSITQARPHLHVTHVVINPVLCMPFRMLNILFSKKALQSGRAAMEK